MTAAQHAMPPPSLAAEAVDFDVLYQETAPQVWRFLKRMGVAPTDLEDVAQDVFLAVTKGLAAFEGRSTARTWVFGIASRVVATYHRRRYRSRVSVAPDALEELAREGVQEDSLDQDRASAILQAILAELDSDKRAVFVLFRVEELPMNEIAIALGCHLKTAYARLYAADRHVEKTARRLQLKEGRKP